MNPKQTRIWLVNQYYGRGVAPTGRLLESLAEALSARGYMVEVICGNNSYQSEAGDTQSSSVHVHRLWSGPRNARSSFTKLMGWLAFWFSLCWHTSTRRLPEVIVVMTTPPLLHGWFVFRNWFNWKKKTKIILWNQDTYPDLFVSFQVIRQGGLRDRFLRWLNRSWLRGITDVIALDRAMCTRLEQAGACRVHLVPNWDPEPHGESPSTPPICPLPTWLEKLNLKAAGFRHRILYSGNYGRGHRLDPMIRYLENSSGNRGIFFLFLGGGARFVELEQLQSRFPDRVATKSYVSDEEYRAVLNWASIGLVSLRDDCAGLMSPSKIHSYLRASLPILLLGPGSCNVGAVIQEFQCGWQVSSEDDQACGELLVRLGSEIDDLSSFREQAQAASKQFDSDPGTERWIKVLEHD